MNLTEKKRSIISSRKLKEVAHVLKTIIFCLNDLGPSFLAKLGNSDFSKGNVGIEDIFGLKGGENNQHDYGLWDNYAAKLHQKKTMP